MVNPYIESICSSMWIGSLRFLKEASVNISGLGDRSQVKKESSNDSHIFVLLLTRKVKDIVLK